MQVSFQGTKEVVVPNVPNNESLGTHLLHFSGSGFLESTDFRVDDEAVPHPSRSCASPLLPYRITSGWP